ncbi:MAG TPA: Xaa-Pro peptidase family protein [Nitrolancea sp.]|nr:Xaa-Pro peptidase family protein [Nitrolancea sp.]
MHSRLTALREALAQAELDAIVITNPFNRRYLTGFEAEDHPPNESAGHVVVSQERAVLVVSPLEATRAREQAPDFETFDKLRPLAAGDAEILKQIGAKRVGIESDAILHADFVVLERELGEQAEFHDASDLVPNLRVFKSPDELALIERAIAITDQALEQVAADLRAGETERELAGRLDAAMRAFGATGNAFATIVAAGPNSALPHHTPGERRIQPGEPIVIDMGAEYNGYCADLTRTVWVGEPNELLRQIYPVVMRALDAAEEHLHAGLTGREADAIARQVIEQAGYGDYFPHSLGHGVGVQIHERPGLSARSEQPLEPAQVVTIEPGIYIPGQGGVRIEDVAIIEANDVRVPTRATKNHIDEEK